MNENNLNENTNPETAAEEIENAAAEEITQTVEEVSAETEDISVEETVEEAPESKSDEEAVDTEDTVNAEEADSSEEPAAEEKTAVSDVTDPLIGETAEEAQEKPAKKKFFLQVPVIIALCLVVTALLGYFVFVGFFLKEPEGVTWSNEVEGVTYYYEFKNDGTFQANVGSIEINSTYQKSKSDEGDSITVGTNIGSLYANAPATYTVSGSRILGNQTFNGSYGEGYDFTLNQSSKKIYMPDLPEDFTADESLIGTWLFKYMGYDIYKVTFGDKGSMVLEFVQDGIKYNGVYTIDDSTINFTYCVSENVVVPIEYTVVDNDNLTFMGYNFVREGSAAAEATPDQQNIITSTVEETEASN